MASSLNQATETTKWRHSCLEMRRQVHLGAPAMRGAIARPVGLKGGTQPQLGGASPSERTCVRRCAAPLALKRCVSTAHRAEHDSVSLQKAGEPRSGAHVLGMGWGAANGGEG